MSTATERTDEQYEKQLTAPLLSEEALNLLDPRTVWIDQAYYEHGFDRLTFIINNLQYSIPACVPTLPTLYFVGFNRPAASEIFAEFQTSTIRSHGANHKFRKIARSHLRKKIWEIVFGVFEPETTREALDYIGFSDEAQTNVLKLNYRGPTQPHPVEFMLRHVVLGGDETFTVGEWVLRYFDRRLRLLTHLDYEIKRRGDINDRYGDENVLWVDLDFLAKEIENKYMDSEYAYQNDFLNNIPLELITELPPLYHDYMETETLENNQLQRPEN